MDGAPSGNGGSYLHATKWHRMFLIPDFWHTTFEVVPIPLAKGSTAGAFSFATRDGCPENNICSFVVVGGDFLKPNERNGTAAYGSVSNRSQVPNSFTRSDTPPHGYRSSVQWSEALKLWITVGTNGSDISRDDGKTWQPLDDGNWNALSLPFVVGPNGRIARINPAALPAAK